MDFDIVLGGFGVAFGLYTLFARKFAPNRLWKLEPMKKMWGEKVGLSIHVLAYTVLPLVLGAILLANSLI
jgi:hypothetical protein